MKKSAIAALVLAASALPAVSQQMKAENQVKYRRAAYQLMNPNFGSLEAMAENKKPFNKDEATRNAEFVAMLSTLTGITPVEDLEALRPDVLLRDLRELRLRMVM